MNKSKEDKYDSVVSWVIAFVIFLWIAAAFGN